MGKLSRRLSLEECVAEYIRDDDAVAIGGLHFHNTPMALVREVIRKRVRLGSLIPPIDGSINADQLIGAGLVDEILSAFVGLEIFGLAPRFRASVEGGDLRVREFEEAGFALAIVAGAAGLPFAALPANFFPVAKYAPTVASSNEVDYAEVMNPFTGALHHVVRAIRPDVALVHCQLVDDLGNCGFLGGAFLDIELAKAASVCVVQAERSVAVLPPECTAVLPAYVVDAVCVLYGGAHPASSHGQYSYDEDHIRMYADLARTDAGFERYSADFIGDSESAYRRASRLPERLIELEMGPVR